MKKGLKLAVVYQVIMHYRLPFYKRISEDENYNFTLINGADQPGTKLLNADISNTNIKNEKLTTFRIKFRTNNSEGTMPVYPNLFFKLIRLSPQVIMSEGASSLVNAFTAFLYSRLFRRKFIWWSLGKLQNREFKGIRKVLNNLQIYIERKSDAIFTYSAQGMDYFKSIGIPAERIFVAVNVLDTNEKLREIEQYADLDLMANYQGCFNIAFIGSITKEKNIEVLIDALRVFNAKNNEVGKLHIIGDGKHIENLKNYIKLNLCTDSVILHGRINKGASAILQHCNLMVLPGLGGLAICEAMLNKLPVITGNADGTEYDLIDDSCGSIIEPLTVENLEEKIQFLFDNPDVAMLMGQSAFDRITNTHSFDKYYSQFEDAVEYVTK
jgi:glycosyltransferase involved in cell wall biosynthesis